MTLNKRKIQKTPLDAFGKPQLLSMEQAVLELAGILPASQYNSRLEILADLAGGKAICTNLYMYKLVSAVHFVCGSGSHGYLYDNGPYAVATLQDAVDSLAETFELGRTRKARLMANSYLELNPGRDGASYCEITKCMCAKPWEHNEDDSPENWPDYDQPEEL